MNLSADIYNELKIIMQMVNRRKKKEMEDLQSKANDVSQVIDASQRSMSDMDLDNL